MDSLIEAVRRGDVRAFYTSTAWEHKRREILQRDNYECQRCKSRGMFSRAEVVHHIKHLKDRPDLALDDDNLVSVCARCHNELHPEKFIKNEPKRRLNIPERW